jgi:hypothetical protein
VRVLARRVQSRLSGRRVRPANLVALRGLVVILDSLAAVHPLPSSLFVPPNCIFTSQAREDLWDAVVKGTAPACEVCCSYTVAAPIVEPIGLFFCGGKARELLKLLCFPHQQLLTQTVQ